MSKPGRTEITRIAQGRTNKSLVIQAAGSLWTVTYQGQAIAGYRLNEITGERKYFPTTFAGAGHARRLAQKLNHWFRTEDFGTQEIAAPVDTKINE